MIAQYLSYGGYHAVHILTDKDEDVKIYLRMRDDHKQDLKKTKQRISVFCLSQGFQYSKGKWMEQAIKELTAQRAESDKDRGNAEQFSKLIKGYAGIEELSAVL